MSRTNPVDYIQTSNFENTYLGLYLRNTLIKLELTDIEDNNY